MCADTQRDILSPHSRDFDIPQPPSVTPCKEVVNPRTAGQFSRIAKEVEVITEAAADLGPEVVEFSGHAIREAADIGLRETDIPRIIEHGVAYLDRSIKTVNNAGLVYLAKRSDVLPGSTATSTIIAAVKPKLKEVGGERLWTGEMTTVYEYAGQTIEDVVARPNPNASGLRFIPIPIP